MKQVKEAFLTCQDSPAFHRAIEPYIQETIRSVRKKSECNREFYKHAK